VFLFLGAVLLLTVGAAALMPPPPPPPKLTPELLKAADRNRDGQVAFAEIKALLPFMTQPMFEAMDTDGDGILTAADIPVPPPPALAIVRLLEHADANNDGRVTFQEVQALPNPIPLECFNRLDANGDGAVSADDLPAPGPENMGARLHWLLLKADASQDGKLSLSELQAVWPHFSQEAFGFLDRNGDGAFDRNDLPAGPPPPRSEMLRRVLLAADVDHDGDVTFEELQALIPELTQESFAHLDRNGDAVINADDVEAFGPGPHERIVHLLEQADADDDGKVSLAELQAICPNVTQEQFNALDVDGDGSIALDDLPKPPVNDIERLIQSLRQADVDGNGEVTFDELKAVADWLTREAFDKLDANDDNVISKEDLPVRPRDPREWLAEKLREADVDRDGQVTFDELAAVIPDLAQERFDQLDRNDDGVLTPEDAPAAPLPPDDGNKLALLRALIEADANHDGSLDYDELTAAFPDAPSELMALLDLNGDWTVTRDEIRAALAQGHDGKPLVNPSDINADGSTDAMDVQVTINHALRLFGGLVRADLDGDGRCDAYDVSGVINGALRIGL